MVVISHEPAALSADDLSAFYTTDELLGDAPILILYGPTSTSSRTTHSRIQAHVYTPAGFQNFARLIISPTATFYSAVICLPREEQGDEICRGLAFSLYRYFAELAPEVKSAWERRCGAIVGMPSVPKLFTESHAAHVAAKMIKVENVADIIVHVRHALGAQTLSWLDVDVVLPRGSIQKYEARESTQFEESDDKIIQQKYGQYARVVKLFGEAAFLPTSKLRRAPSKPTALNKSQSFSRTQKETLRREMCELLDTEENYVSKVHELVHTVAVEFRDKAKQKSTSSSSPNEEALKALFPPSLDRILEVNSKFLDAIRAVLEETENGAIDDIETATDDVFIAPLRGLSDPLDVTGASAVAKTLVEWLPHFSDCYTDYMAAHGGFSQLLKLFTQDPASSFSRRIGETGEQRLTSMLIEPVQRLPRYNLYIDNIIKQLPARHQATKTFLKARDVISEICSREAPSVQQIKISERLRNIVSNWPATFVPQGRLITAADYVELPAPYHGELSGPTTSSGLLLLFTDTLVFLHKSNGSTVNARGLLADMDSPKLAVVSNMSTELVFHRQLKHSDVFLSEHSEGSILQVLLPALPSHHVARPRSRDRPNYKIRMLYLLGFYEERASRLVEEITKARVEGRFSETERDSHKWEVRSLAGDLNLFASITELDERKAVGRKEPARVQILVQGPGLSSTDHLCKNGVEIVIAISLSNDGFLVMDTQGLQGFSVRDKLAETELVPVLTKRLANYFQLRNGIANPLLSEAYLSRNQQILHSLNLQTSEVEEHQQIKGRAHSPVKMLSTLFGGSVSKEGGSRKLIRSAATLVEIPRMALPPNPPSRTQSRDGETSRPTSSSKFMSFNGNVPVDPGALLEETLTNLALALHARKGNIVGRSVRARSVADELVVNELYNALLETPGNLELASQSSVNVLFAVFDKFLSVAWKEAMGPVLSHATLVSLQMRSDSMSPLDFEEFFRSTIMEFTLPNQRALRVVMYLLANLLEGTGNDGDRGVLTAAFAEMLVPAGNANDFISLMDRLVQDIDTLLPSQSFEHSALNYGSTDSRGRVNATGSINSNTSLRKRFGFGTLTRENSKPESESKVGSLWRTLSKSSHGTDSQPSSMSKAGPPTLARSNSTDVGRLSPKRPSSRDRPTVLGAFAFENASVSGRSLLGTLGTIGEVPSATGPPRKKRRSSLSDLKLLQVANDVPSWSPQTPHGPDFGPRARRQSSASPRTPLRSTPSPVKHNSAIPTPTRLGSPNRKENSPANVLDRAGNARWRYAAAPVDAKDEFTVKSASPTKKRGDSVTNIPTLKPITLSHSGLLERPSSGNTIKMPSSGIRSPTKTGGSSTSPAKRLRMQSPQKLRERLQNQQRDIDSASGELQTELGALKHEQNFKSIPRFKTQSSAPRVLSEDAHARDTENRLASLEQQVKTTLEALSTSTSTISSDVKNTLQVSEARCKYLDQLYRDTNAENEALYARFNEELDKMSGAAQEGSVSQEVERRLKASEEDAARLRKENARLKREVAGLKAQLRE